MQFPPLRKHWDLAHRCTDGNKARVAVCARAASVSDTCFRSPALHISVFVDVQQLSCFASEDHVLSVHRSVLLQSNNHAVVWGSDDNFAPAAPWLLGRTLVRFLIIQPISWESAAMSACTLRVCSETGG